MHVAHSLDTAASRHQYWSASVNILAARTDSTLAQPTNQLGYVTDAEVNIGRDIDLVYLEKGLQPL